MDADRYADLIEPLWDLAFLKEMPTPDHIYAEPMGAAMVGLAVYERPSEHGFRKFDYRIVTWTIGGLEALSKQALREGRLLIMGGDDAER